MIGNAYRLLVPYVAACPACSDNLFTAIANRTIEEMHREAHDKGKLAGYFMSVRTGHERDEGELAHLEAARDFTVELLREVTGADLSREALAKGEPHQHEG